MERVSATGLETEIWRLIRAIWACYISPARVAFIAVSFFAGWLVYQPSMARTRTKIPEAIGETQNNLFSN